MRFIDRPARNGQLCGYLYSLAEHCGHKAGETRELPTKWELPSSVECKPGASPRRRRGEA